MAGVYVRHRFADHRHEGLGRRLCYTVSVVDTPGAKYGPAAHEPIAVYAGYGNTPDATGFKFIAWSLVEEIDRALRRQLPRPGPSGALSGERMWHPRP
jgi:hypothetical protein